MLSLLQFVVIRRPRDTLGERCPIEVMTDRFLDMTLDLIIDSGVDRVNKYYDGLQVSRDVINVEISDVELKKQCVKVVKEPNNRLVHRFEVGDLVMVTVTDTSVNPVNLHKSKM